MDHQFNCDIMRFFMIALRQHRLPRSGMIEWPEFLFLMSKNARGLGRPVRRRRDGWHHWAKHIFHPWGSSYATRSWEAGKKPKKISQLKWMSGGLVASFYVPIYWVSIIIPIDEVIFFRGVAKNHQPGKSFCCNSCSLAKRIDFNRRFQQVFDRWSHLRGDVDHLLILWTALMYMQSHQCHPKR